MAASWAPSVDIFETEQELVLTAEVPGIDEKDIEIEIENNTLTIRGKILFGRPSAPRATDKRTKLNN